jgi:hypothetical protein
MRLGSMLLDYTFQGGQPVNLEVGLIAGLTRLDVEFWGFECPRCQRYARKLFLPLGKRLFLCRTCHGLRYISQAKLDAISRSLGDEWDDVHRAMGIPPAKFWRAAQRAGQCVFRVPSPI